MSALTVRIHKYLDSDMVGSPRVPARVYTIESLDPSIPSAEPLQTLVPITERPTDVARLDLVPGTYYVESMLPSGELLTGSVRLGTDETRDLVLHAKDSPNEWFSWQHLMGNARQAIVPPETTSPRRRRRPKGTRKKKAKKRLAASSKSGGSRRGIVTGRVVRPPAAPSAGELTGPEIGRPIGILASPHPAFIMGDPRGAEAWRLLADASSRSADELAAQLNQGATPAHLAAYVHDAERAVYRLRWAGDAGTSAFPLASSVPNAERYFAAVPRRSRLELLSLPLPWVVVGTGREATVEIGVQQVHAPDEYSASLTPLDERLGMLLGFLSAGSLNLVREMAETARDMLFFKVENPYAAAAGGYAMVATALSSDDQDWHGWIRNLMHNFPHIPDGAIQWAHLRLKTRRRSSDIDEARDALKTAYRRGLPFYSMGIKWLVEGLEWIGRDDSEADEMLRNVRRVAWLTNFRQAFTILRLGGGANV